MDKPIRETSTLKDLEEFIESDDYKTVRQKADGGKFATRALNKDFIEGEDFITIAQNGNGGKFASRALKKDFIENDDFKVIAQNGENPLGGMLF